ncbi:MAG: hypothetical protein ACLR56_01015 [Oscillospiraceae bacterium]
MYCIMDGWNTVARAFFDVTAATDPFPEDAPSVKLDKNTVILGSSEQHSPLQIRQSSVLSPARNTMSV